MDNSWTIIKRIFTERGVIIAFLFFACNMPKQSKPYIRLEGKAQGTTFSIIYADSLQRNFAKETDSLFRKIDKSLSLWDTTSILSNFNKNTPNTIADEHFEKNFKRSMEISQITEGAFDVTIAPLVKRWGFHFKKNETAPNYAEVKSLLTCCGWQKIRLEKGVLVKEKPCMLLDFNAIAQGYTVDIMAQFLENQGIKNYMVEIGGEVRAAGHNETGELWQIGIDKPVENAGNMAQEGRPLQRIVALSGKSMATSGSYRKFIVRDGKKYSHLIDPATGFPVQHNLLSVSVIADNCTDADAFATAFMVMGLEKAKVQAAKLGVAALFIFQNEKQALEEVQVGNF